MEEIYIFSLKQYTFLQLKMNEDEMKKCSANYDELTYRFQALTK